MLSRCHPALLTDGDAGAARGLLDELGERLMAHERMEAHFLLWKATSKSADLTEAQRLLQQLRDNAPEEYRDSMIQNVPLHRDIAAAWRQHRGSEDETSSRP